MKEYWCGRCGAYVGQEAKSCPKCGVTFGGVREGTQTDRDRASQHYAHVQFQCLVDRILCFLDEHWLPLLLSIYGMMLLSCYWLYNYCLILLIILTVIISYITGAAIYNKLREYLSYCVSMPMHVNMPPIEEVEFEKSLFKPKPHMPKPARKHKPFFDDSLPEPKPIDDESTRWYSVEKIPPLIITKKIITSPPVPFQRFPVLKTVSYNILYGKRASTITVEYVSWRLFLFSGIFGTIIFLPYALGLLCSYGVAILLMKAI